MEKTNNSNNPKSNSLFKPKIIGFLCNWCSYAGADLAGVSRLQYPPNIHVIRIMCSGRLDPAIVIEMFMQGADGVFIGGCHIGDCHYVKGNHYTEKRYLMAKKLLGKTGLNSDRLQLRWISASEGQLFAETMKEINDLIATLGPSPVSGDKPNLEVLENLFIIRNIVEDFRLRILIGKGVSLVGEHNVYNEKLNPEQYEKLVDAAIDNEYIRGSIMYLAREKPVSVFNLATRIKVTPKLVLKNIVTLKDRELLKVDHVEGVTPYYISKEHEEFETIPLFAKQAVGGD